MHMCFSFCLCDLWFLGESPPNDVRLGFVSRPGGVQSLCCLEAAGYLGLKHRAGPLRSLNVDTQTRTHGSGWKEVAVHTHSTVWHFPSSMTVLHEPCCITGPESDVTRLDVRDSHWLCCISTADLCSVRPYAVGSVVKQCHLYQIMTLKG